MRRRESCSCGLRNNWLENRRWGVQVQGQGRAGSSGSRWSAPQCGVPASPTRVSTNVEIRPACPSIPTVPPNWNAANRSRAVGHRDWGSWVARLHRRLRRLNPSPHFHHRKLPLQCPPIQAQPPCPQQEGSQAKHRRRRHACRASIRSIPSVVHPATPHPTRFRHHCRCLHRLLSQTSPTHRSITCVSPRNRSSPHGVERREGLSKGTARHSYLPHAGDH